jgi:NADPH:quinone reductase-like Zn-dependent oxidoreductase
MSATTMHAVLASGGVELDDPGALRDGEVAAPELRPRDVLVRVRAVSVNPVRRAHQRVLGDHMVGKVVVTR